MDFPLMLRRGLGRVVLFLRDQDARPYRVTILHACTHFLGYDAQTEPTRGRYLYDVIQATGEPDWYVPRIIELLASGEKVEAPHTLLELVSVIAENGNAEARAAVHAAFARAAEQSDDYGAEEVVTLDGIEGYFSVARQWMQHPRREEDHWYEGWLLDSVEKEHGQEQFRAALQRVQAVEPALRGYVEQAREKRRVWEKKRGERTPTPAPTYEELLTRLDDVRETVRWPRWRRWGLAVTEDALHHLADDLVSEADRGRLLKLLHLFRDRPYPHDPLQLIGLAQGRDEDIATAARKALSHLSSPLVRRVALEVISSAERPWEGIELLADNYEKGDYTLFAEILTGRLSADECHWVGFAIFDVIKANPTPDAVEVLSLLYEQEPCPLCRHRVVKHWQSLGPLPDWLIQECRYDSDLETRKLVAA